MLKKQQLFTIVLSLLIVSLNAQSKKEIEIKNNFWGSGDTQKNNTDIPDKWKNESAVILYKEYFYDYHKFAKNVDFSSSFRKRIKLLDKAAIKEHSEFSFVKKFRVNRGWGKRGSNYVGVKIIKPDGTEREIKIDQEAVKTDDEYKLAISGLEVGDILDYYIYRIEPFKQKYGYTFEPITRILSDDYPTKEMVVRFNTENDFFINFNSYNGAPPLEEIKTDKRNDRRYILKANDIEKSDFPFWYYPLNELPYYKFQVTFARRGSHENAIFDFLSEDEQIIKQRVSKEDVLSLYKDHWDYDYKNFRFREVEDYLEGKGLSAKEKIVAAYYFFRHYYLTQFAERAVLAESEIIPAIYYGTSAYDRYFFAMDNVSLMQEYLDRQKIPYNYVISVPRSLGNIKDVLFKSEISDFLEVRLDNETLYLPPLNINSTVNNINYEIEGTDAYVLKRLEGERKLSAVEKVKTPSSLFSENGTSEKITASLTENMEALDIQKTTSFLGNSKSQAQEDLLFYFDFMLEDYKKYNNDDYVTKEIKGKKNIARIRNEASALMEKLKKRQIEYLEKNTEKEFDFEIDDYSFEIKNTGRYGIAEPMVLSEHFTINNTLVKRAGKNYLLELGKLIGGQVSLNEKEKNRSSNVYMNFPRSFSNEIEFTIPEGYKVSGVSELNVSVKNHAGGFESNARVEANRLIIKTHKYYAHYFEDNAAWADMVDFLNAAYQFTQKKILLKKE